MFEAFIKSVSTVLFIICATLLQGVLPQESDSTPAMSTAVEGGEALLVGEWEAFGRRYEFTSSGKLETGSETLDWYLDDNDIVVTDQDGERRLPLEKLDEQSMRLNGVTYYRMSGK